jgi:cob(I)alamin adenosyltransferase
MTKVYTKTGDKGETSLVGGSRVLKSDYRIDIYGDVDELNSFIGLLISSVLENKLAIDVETLEIVQNNLFNLGSQLACEVDKRDQYKLPAIDNALTHLLEKKIDLMDEDLQKLKNFILPGGSVPASFAHLARTICRRVERKLVAANCDLNYTLPENGINFINRLSDYLFVYARFINLKLGKPEVLWSPKK